jgi:hypothetical protein
VVGVVVVVVVVQLQRLRLRLQLLLRLRLRRLRLRLRLRLRRRLRLRLRLQLLLLLLLLLPEQELLVARVAGWIGPCRTGGLVNEGAPAEADWCCLTPRQPPDVAQGELGGGLSTR